MPHRIISYISIQGNAFIDILTLSSLALWQGAVASISSEDWNKITGPHGLVFVLIIGLIVVWTKSVRDDASRERRHRETIAAQQEHFEALIQINEKTANDLKGLTVESTKAQMASTNAILSMDHNIVRLTTELSDQSKLLLRRARKAKHIECEGEETE